MATDSLAFRTAKQHVLAYSAESTLMERHAQAIECRDCEAFLQLGIDAFDWLMRADRLQRMEVYRGAREYDLSFDEALHALCRSWLEPCAFADGWIETQLTRGFEIENLVRFRQCADEMIAMVAARESEQQALPGAIAELRDAAIGEHHDGETAEFI